MTDRANIRILPPLVLAGALVIGALAAWGLPGRLLAPRAANAVGALLILASLLIGMSALRAMRRARTSVDPRRPTTALVREGAFRLSRNPLYLGMLLLYAGVAFLVNSPWMLVLTAPLMAALWLAAIGPEERYLAAKFGEDYRAYRAEVRRWI